MKTSIFRPLHLVLLGAITIVLIALLTTSWLTYREQQRLVRARTALTETLAFHEQHSLVERSVMAHVTGRPGLERVRLVEQIDSLTAMCAPGDHATRTLLVRLRGQLSQPVAMTPDHRDATMGLLQEIAMSETRFETGVISELQRASDRQLFYEMAAPLALLAITIVAIPIARRRVVKPLEDFGRQISGLAEGHFTPTPESEVSEHTLPLHRNLIELAVRLQELEREQRERADSLEQEVRGAAAALLEQQQSLARAERLAVAGELAASVAHEIRNPLAGIQMSLTNLRHELDDSTLGPRVDGVVAEVERLGRLVGEIVDAARHEPEPSTLVDLNTIVDELISLTRYQLPTEVRVESRVREGLHAHVPRERLRQALLNLVLNAATAIGAEPGRIEIEIDDVDTGLRVQVSDDGPGFPDELLSGGIRPFQSTRRHGSGLGLAMVRRFVRDAAGSMQIENRSPGDERPGARVTLLLPSAVENG